MTAAAVLAAGAGALVAVALVDVAAALAARRARPARAVGTRRRPVVVAALVRLGRRLGSPAAPADLDARIEAAGRPLGLDARDVMAAKGAGGLAALFGGAPLAAALPGRLPLVAAIGLPLAGFVAPDVLIARRTRARGRAMAAELPDLLDLLRVSVAAGLPLGRALSEVGARHGGALAREWRAAAARIDLGVPQAAALQRLVARCPVPAVGTLAAALRRAERHGAPLADTLAAQAAEARAAHARRLHEQAAKAAPKIQLVVALMLVPAAMLLVAAALVASLAAGG
ncbi:MAG TPA: type II secretion system F family protein [Solirubrobacteraceae bacterium]|nr:type II secretion system F family protein [Solirubrobacteraceae bacterium]